VLNLSLRAKIRRIADRSLERLYRLERSAFDSYMGVSTGGYGLETADFIQANQETWPYLGGEWPAVYFALRALRSGPDDVFVDFGAGKGRALLMAGRLPYRRVVGVELDPELAQCARRNLAQARWRLRAGAAACETANVLDWPFPDDASTVFLFNPFYGQTFRRAISKIFDSYDRNPRRIHIVYENPQQHDWLLSTGRVVVEGVRPEMWPSTRRWWTDWGVIVTYHVTGTSGSSDTGQCLVRKKKPANEAIIRWSGPTGQASMVRDLGKGSGCR
jgi:SAM-dependent methyltransferase